MKATYLQLVIHDVVAAIRGADDAVLRLLPGYLPPGARLTDGAPQRTYDIVSSPYRVLADGREIGSTTDPIGVCEILEGDLNIFMAEHARGLIFVHAGVVEWKGRAIVIPGRTLAGKSTLVSALVQAGATYYSDEYAPIDAQGNVHPHPRPLSLRQPVGWPLRIPPENPGTQPVPVGLMALTAYRPHAAFQPRDLTWSRAMLRMLDNTVPARSRPQESLHHLKQALARARCVQGPRGDAAETAKVLLEMAS